jgi:hypothetical protein
LAPRLQSVIVMVTTSLTMGTQITRLEVGIGACDRQDTDAAVASAAADAGARLGGAVPDLALVVTAGEPARDVIRPLRDEFGHLGVAGGGAPALLTDHGLMREGALVVGIANAESAASGAVATAGRDLGDAAQAAARLILAGWPFRARYPRGIGFAFARAGAGERPVTFLDSWRAFMGPKMRTVCSVLGSPVLYGQGTRTPHAAVATIEAAYASGLGLGEGASESPDALVHEAADTASTALKRLDGRPARLVLVVETTARYRALGTATADEWAAIRGQLDERTPCAGWLCADVAAYGRGVQPTSTPNALIVLALGDIARA